MRRGILILCTLLLASLGISQDKLSSFSVELSTDTVYLGNAVGVKYSLQNITGDFQPPEFGDLNLVAGPMVSSNFSMINGDVTQSASYEYVFLPEVVGVYYLDPAIVLSEEQDYHSASVQIYVIDNPEGIQQDHRSYGGGVKIDNSTRARRDTMSRADSLRIKLRHLKSKKI